MLRWYCNEGDEPSHVHVTREWRTAKIWLLPVALARSNGFNEHELRRIHAVVLLQQRRFLEVWHACFAR